MAPPASSPSPSLLLCACIGAVCLRSARAFVPAPPSGVVEVRRRHRDGGALFSSPNPTGSRPPPRRTLKKRKNKRRQRMDKLSQNIKDLGGSTASYDDATHEDDDIEVRPVRRRDAVEAGMDYWIDEGDLERERRRRIASKNRKSMEGAMPKEKLREEVVAPYKQNWIGILSVAVVVLSAIGTNFPELLQIPVIPIPDL
ncbi:hypothetical protein ACHAXT_012579 [Thalassiosira profunda]